MLAGELIENADDLVLHQAQPLGARRPWRSFMSMRFGGRAAFRERRLEAAVQPPI